MTQPTNPTPDIEAVKARVWAALACDRQYVRCWHGDHEVQLCDLRALLAALDAVQAENAALRERLAATSGWAEDEELAALREDKANLARITKAWTKEGVNPAYHREQRGRLFREWPTLAEAVEHAARTGRGDE